MKFFRFITRSLLLLAIALLSALAAMRIAIHGREVQVPNLKNLTVLQAQEAANANGLFVSVEDRFYSSDVSAGKIISQMPSPANRVRRGWRVRVAESLGPPRVAVPDLLGQTELAATLNLRKRGLDLGTVAAVQVPQAVAHQVIAQAPPPNGEEMFSPKVSILLAETPGNVEYVMPNFVGRSLAEVKEKIARVGLQIASVAVENPVGAPASPGDASVVVPVSGTISSQSPPPGSRVSSETQIRLETARRSRD